MNCRDALQRMDLFPARRLQDGGSLSPGGAISGAGDDDPAWTELQAHLRECGLCRVAYDAHRLEDTALRGRLNDVVIPPGLEGRLRDALESVERTRTRGGAPRLVRLWGTVAALVVATVSVWWWQGSRGRVSLDTVRHQINAQVLDSAAQFDALPVIASAAGLVPGWEWRGLVREESGRGLEVDGRPGVDACIYRFADAATHVRGYLVVLPTSLLKSAPTNGLPGAIQYRPLPSTAWVAGEHAYVCVAQEGDLSRLLQALYGTAA